MGSEAGRFDVVHFNPSAYREKDPLALTVPVTVTWPAVAKVELEPELGRLYTGVNGAIPDQPLGRPSAFGSLDGGQSFGHLTLLNESNRLALQLPGFLGASTPGIRTRHCRIRQEDSRAQAQRQLFASLDVVFVERGAQRQCRVEHAKKVAEPACQLPVPALSTSRM